MRRRATEGQLELDPLVEAPSREDANPAELALLEAADACLARYLDERAAGASDLRPQRALIECVEPYAPPPPAGQREHDPCGHEPRRRRHQQRDPNDRGESRRELHRPAETEELRHGEPGERRPEQEVCREDTPHGTTSRRRSARRAGPMPGIASSSSTEVNPPCCAR